MYDNFSAHSADFPTAAYLQSVTALGQTAYGMADVGDSNNTAGSDLIISAVDKVDTRPLWISCWGGCNTLAQAIWRIQGERSVADVNTFLDKIRVIDIAGQDDSGAWMTHNYPNLFYIRALRLYAWQPTETWLNTNVINDHGVFGAAYQTYSPAEVDSSTFLHLLSTGLNDPERIDQGGWGGRYSTTPALNQRSISVVLGEDAYDDYYMYVDGGENSSAITRWGDSVHNDFAARMDWSNTNIYGDANHSPVAALNGNTSNGIWEFDAAAGADVVLSAAGSSDPDADNLSYAWSFYSEPSSYGSAVTIQNNTSESATVQIPSDAAGETLHIILEVQDDGTPILSDFRRVIISVI